MCQLCGLPFRKALRTLSSSRGAHIRFNEILTEMTLPECNGCFERCIRTLREQLLWVRTFQNLEELQCALAEFRERYNQRWIVQRWGYLTPA